MSGKGLLWSKGNVDCCGDEAHNILGEYGKKQSVEEYAAYCETHPDKACNVFKKIKEYVSGIKLKVPVSNMHVEEYYYDYRDNIALVFSLYDEHGCCLYCDEIHWMEEDAAEMYAFMLIKHFTLSGENISYDVFRERNEGMQRYLKSIGAIECTY